MKIQCQPLSLWTTSQITTTAQLTSSNSRHNTKVPFFRIPNNSNSVVCSAIRPCIRIAICTNNHNSFQYTGQKGFKMGSLVTNLTMIIWARLTSEQATRSTNRQVFFQIYEALRVAIISSKASPNPHFWLVLLGTIHFSDKIRLTDCLKSKILLNFEF